MSWKTKQKTMIILKRRLFLNEHNRNLEERVKKRTELWEIKNLHVYNCSIQERCIEYFFVLSINFDFKINNERIKLIYSRRF